MQSLIKIGLIVIVSVGSYFLFKGLSVSDVDDDEAHGYEEDEEEEEVKVLTVDGNKAIRIEADEIEAFSIELDKIQTREYQAETLVYAKVIDIKPLLQQYTEYKKLKAQIAGANTSLVNQNNRVKRAEKLHEAKSMSTREYESIRAERDESNASLRTLKTELENLQLNIQSEWGQTLSQQISNEGGMLQGLINYKSSLVSVVTARAQQFDPEQATIYMGVLPKREQAQEAKYIGRANVEQNSLLGEGYLYLLDVKRLSPRMRLFAWIVESDSSETAVFIPESAVIWYANSPWFYINQDDELFIRIKLEEAKELEDGWLLNDERYLDADLVIKGAQSLFSQEFKWAIPDEDDD